MAKFRKKPVVIEAVASVGEFIVQTPEGPSRAKHGDIIITGVAGEMYPCRLDIFLATYEPLDEEAQQVIDLAMKMADPEVLKKIEKIQSNKLP